MSKILDNLYLGNWHDAQNLTFLTSIKATHIICIGEELRPIFPSRFTYLHLRAKDHPNFKLTRFLSITTPFIKSLLDVDSGPCSKGVTIFIHCYAGISRSPSVLLAYLISKGESLTNALEFVRSRRPCVRPNYGFLCELERLEFKNKGTATKSKKAFRIRKKGSIPVRALG